MRRCTILVSVVVVAAVALSAQGRGPAAGAPAPSAQIPSVKGLERLQQWAGLVRQHTPGEWDEAARTVAAWPATDLSSVVLDLSVLHTLMTGARQGSRFVNYGINREMQLTQVPAMLLISNGDAGLGRSGAAYISALQSLERDVAHVMKLAAMLHADIAVLAPTDADAASVAAARRSFITDARVVDGQVVGMSDVVMHWTIGLRALASIRPDPAADPFVAQWYRATAAWQLHGRRYGDATRQLNSAVRVWPADATIQFDSGVLHENLAASPVQAAMESMGATSSLTYDGVSQAQHLETAERIVRSAIDLGLTDGPSVARVRLARVLSLRGRHEESSAELRQALPALTDRRWQYYADLFLGREERSLGDPDGARAAFERARGLFPRAQSPLLALSQVAFQGPNPTAALAPFGDLVALPAAGRDDPWWVYDIAPVSDAGARYAALCEAARVEQLRR